ncbi:MAG: galactose mutarotase [Verrucomicrobiae bacterium]|nr:galactose mutarotase [Verrucomicrobiae bacterium]NNJ87379.1 galactose mutarotase [Akkermansiaceae bacterium]
MKYTASLNFAGALVLALFLTGCQKNTQSETESGIGVTEFGALPDGSKAKLYTLTNKHGVEARITDFGATLVSLMVPDKDGKLADVTLGFDNPAAYLAKENPYFGATVGRFGNRIAHGKFTLDGKEYSLATNNSPGDIPCHLHGGNKGFNRVLWKGEADEAGNAVTFTYVSADGEEGYPGKLTTKVTYTLNDDNELIWEAEATTDAPTVLNLVHHSYWNLSGEPTTSINDHLLTLDAEHFLPTNAGLIPTGEKAPVADTPMDFTQATEIGKRVEADFEALKLAGGYDHCWVLKSGKGVRRAARLEDPKSGRVIEIFTDQPAIQFYGGNFLDGTVAGKGGVKYPHRSGLCLETENFPDAPNNKDFPSAVLRPGETYKHVMIHRFSVR